MTASRGQENALCDILFGALRIYQPDENSGPRVNVDTVLLADFARFSPRARVLEMGCAHGAISLILAKRRALSGKPAGAPRIEGIDINEALIRMASENATINALADDTFFSVRDLRDCRKDYKPETFDVVVMNPPYDEPGRSRPSPREPLASAMHGSECTLLDAVATAKYLLRNGGRFFLVMRAQRAGELFALLDERNVKPKRVRFVHPKPDRDASVVLVEAVRAAGSGLVVEPPIYIYGDDGAYTEPLLAAYRLEA